MASFLFWASFLFVAYVYIGYPLLLWVMANIFPRATYHSPFLPTVTLLIAAYNEEISIAQKLENSLALDYPPEYLQILVTADGSDDGTVEIVETFEKRGVELIFNTERKGKMAAINRALSFARGEIVVMSDANNQYEPNTIRAIVSPYSDPSVGAACGAKSIYKSGDMLSSSEGIYWKYEAWIKQQETLLGCCTAAAGEIFSFRKSIFISPPDGIINDDFYIMMLIIKQGKRVVYVPDALSTEHISLSAKDEIERRTRMIAGRYQAISHGFKLLPFDRPVIVWQVISHKFLRPLVPFGMIGAFLASLFSVIWPASAENFLLLKLAFPYNWIIFMLQISFYLLALFGEKINKMPLGRWHYIPAFLLNSNKAALYGLLRFLTGKQTTQWKRVRRG